MRIGWYKGIWYKISRKVDYYLEYYLTIYYKNRKRRYAVDNYWVGKYFARIDIDNYKIRNY